MQAAARRLPKLGEIIALLPANVPVITLCLFKRVREEGEKSLPALMNKALIAGIQFPALIVSAHVTGIAVVLSSHSLHSLLL